jgi:hypothetical protein
MERVFASARRAEAMSLLTWASLGGFPCHWVSIATMPEEVMATASLSYPSRAMWLTYPWI